MLSMLPVRSKFKRRMKHLDRTELQNCNRMVLEEAFRIIPKQWIAAGNGGIIVDWVDLQRQDCYPRLTPWITYYLAYCKLHGLKPGPCIWSEYPRSKLGSLQAHARQDYHIYRGWWKTGKHNLLKSVGVKVVNKRGWGLSGVDIVRSAKPDLLHTISTAPVDNVVILGDFSLVRVTRAIWRHLEVD